MEHAVQRLTANRASLSPHFMGALVVTQLKTFGKQVQAFEIIDGQQRLTTFQLLLAALRDIATDNSSRYADELQKYIVNDGVMENPDVERYKLWPLLNSLDVLIYVSDLQTYELLFVNDYGQKTWGKPQVKQCFEYLQAGQHQPCSFCTNKLLLDAEGKPKGVHVWEFQNTVNQRWYQCRDQAIHWIDGRYVRLEIAVDITVSKELEQKLRDAKQEAETLARIDPLTNAYNR